MNINVFILARDVQISLAVHRATAYCFKTTGSNILECFVSRFSHWFYVGIIAFEPLI